MRRAIEVARAAVPAGDYPVGAVVVRDGRIIAESSTRIQSLMDPSAHAEVLAIRGAAIAAGSVYLPGAVLYSTLEPCPMCASLAIWARLDGIVYGASLQDGLDRYRESRGHEHDWRQIAIKVREIVDRGEPGLELVGDFLRDECLALLRLI
jgi:tRNA(Arg) A34 adenosine deaminase TadA